MPDLDNIFEIGTRVETAPLSAGMEQAEGTVETATSSMRSFFASLAQSVRSSTSSMVTGMKEAALGIAEAGDEIKEKLVEVGEGAKLASGGVGSAFGALGVLIGGQMVLEFLNHIKESEIELLHLSEATGITVSRLASFKAIMEQNGNSTDRLGMNLTKLAVAMAHAKDGSSQAQNAFRGMGIDTKQWGDTLPPTDQILMRLADHLQHSSDKTRDMANAQQLLGRGSVTLVGFLRQGSEALEQQMRLSKGYGDAAQEAAESAKQFQRTEAQVTQSLKTGLLPAFNLIVITVESVVAAFHYLGAVFDSIGRVLLGSALQIITAFKGIGNVVGDVLSGNFKKAAVDATGAAAEIKDQFSLMSSDISKSFTDSQAAVDKLFAHAPEEAGKAEDDSLPPIQKASKTRVDIWRDELVQRKLEADAFHDVTAADEAAYWKHILDTQKLSAAESRAVRAELLRAGKQAQKDEVQDFVENKRLEIAELQKHSRDQITILTAIANEYKEKYGERSREYRQAVIEIKRAEGELTQYEIQEATKQADEWLRVQEARVKGAETAASDEVQFQRREFDFKKQMFGASLQDQLNAERKFENDEFKIKHDSLNAQAKMYEQMSAAHPMNKQYAVQLQKLHQQVQQVERKHQQQLIIIDQQAALQRKKIFDGIYGAITQSFNGSVMEMLKGTKTFTQAAGQALAQLADQGINASLNLAEHWIADRLREMIFGKEKKIEESAMEQSSAIEKESIAMESNFVIAMSDAAVAAAGAFAWMSGIFPPAAPGFAAGYYATGQGFADLAFFEQGGITADDGLAYLHKKEMVLPADIADGLQRNIGGGSQMRSVSVSVQHNVTAIDAKGVREMMREHGGVIGDEIARRIRIKGGH